MCTDTITLGGSANFLVICITCRAELKHIYFADAYQLFIILFLKPLKKLDKLFIIIGFFSCLYILLHFYCML